jgi:hypothetical protein
VLSGICDTPRAMRQHLADFYLDATTIIQELILLFISPSIRSSSSSISSDGVLAALCRFTARVGP